MPEGEEELQRRTNRNESVDANADEGYRLWSRVKQQKRSSFSVSAADCWKCDGEERSNTLDLDIVYENCICS